MAEEISLYDKINNLQIIPWIGSEDIRWDMKDWTSQYHNAEFITA